MIIAVVVASGPRLPQALALLQALARHHPELPRRLLLADRRPVEPPTGLGAAEVIAADDLGLTELPRLAFALEPPALAQLLLAQTLHRLLALPDCRGVIALDAEADLQGPLLPFTEALRHGSDAVLLPRALPGQPQEERDLLRAGLYDPGCFALGATPEGRRLAAWWSRASLADGEEQAMALDGRWLDLVPAYCARPLLLRHPGLGVTPANAARRGLRLVGAEWRLGEQPLLLARFQPGALSAGAAGEALLAAWQARLAAAARLAPPRPGAFDLTATGEPIPPLLRRYFGAVLAGQVAAPFRPDADWFSAPASGLPLLAGERFSRFAQYLHDSGAEGVPQLDLRQPAARRHLAAWLREGGLGSLGFGPALARLALAGLEPAEVGAAPRDAPVDAGLPALPLRASRGERLVGLVWRARGLYRLIPAGLRRPLRRLLLRLTRTQTSLLVGDATESPPVPLQRPAKPDPALPDGAVLLGYPEAELGLGQALRGLARGLLDSGVPLRVANFSAHIVAHQQRDRSLSHLIDNRATAKAQVFCINADQLPLGLAEIGAQRVAQAYNIAYPFWELARLPAVWVPNFAAIDEVWAPSRFIQETLAQSLAQPVIHMGVGVQLPRACAMQRRDFGIAENRFAFLFFFDYTSYASRKNPEAVMAAFRQAFPPGDPAPVTLVLKAMGRDLEHGRRARIAELAAADPRICLIDRALTPEEQAALLGAVDALVSLHRSEGFGLGMAEALLLGKPVVATAYGGCMDFLTADNACLVDYRLIPVAPGQYPHGEGQLWADPDLDQAAHYLRRLVAEPAWGRALARRGQHEVATLHSPAAVGRRAAERLRSLRLIA